MTQTADITRIDDPCDARERAMIAQYEWLRREREQLWDIWEQTFDNPDPECLFQAACTDNELSCMENHLPHGYRYPGEMVPDDHDTTPSDRFGTVIALAKRRPNRWLSGRNS